ncbi:hypothetical protein [Akkermansia glycaniphila]|uniref:Uncharacterized protein n=1 Tax=Akkermansia glycaniphila TaxID=1679444 RepID=A0A1C7PF44_9BACT|nr:hypothetical protein [Akkermansia glycaniphila]OCA02323.1 hypothetical protein AC781_10855 [Akkermansia glycaniphila]OCA04191.1 hypothetical protein AC781_00415 [Akkermansia glycaniphila]SEH87670.1 Hypothetical protein PYTT_1391 [Akkermansia glycaniphila]
MATTPKNTDKPQAETPAEPAVEATTLRCTITARSLLIGRMYHARGTIVDIPSAKAAALEQAGKLRILG